MSVAVHLLSGDESVAGHAKVSLGDNTMHRIINPRMGGVATFYGIRPGQTKVSITVPGHPTHVHEILVPVSGEASFRLAGVDHARSRTITEMLRKFAPLVRLHPDDDYRPASIDWYLERSHMMKALRRFTDKGEVDRRKIGDYKDPNWSIKLADDDDRRGDLAAAMCYGHAIEHSRYMELQYWFFYPYNGPMWGFGTHEGDWEHISIKVVDGKAVKYFFATHTDGDTHEPNEMLTDQGHVVVFSAKHSHASYKSKGKQERKHLPDDHTDFGQAWETWRRLERIDRRLGWIRYPGRWGSIKGPAHQGAWRGDRF